MKEEIDAAAQFLTQLVSQNQPANISDDQLQQFKFHLARLFEERFHDHWFPDRPQRGQAFRCIRLNSISLPDPLIEQAATETGLDYQDLKLPVEFTMWVDPWEVSCRFGEHEGSYCTVASFEKETDSKVTIDTMESLRVITDHDNSALAHHHQHHHQQHSPRRLSRGKLSPHLSPTSPTSINSARLHHHHHQQQQQQQQNHHQQQAFRLNAQLGIQTSCFYPNYETAAHGAKGWYPVTTTASFGALSPPLAISSYHTPKARAYAGWRLAYVPAVRYLANNWPMGQMLKV